MGTVLLELSKGTLRVKLHLTTMNARQLVSFTSVSVEAKLSVRRRAPRLHSVRVSFTTLEIIYAKEVL